MRPYDTIHRSCETCGKPFTTLFRKLALNQGRFCSLQCAGMARRNGSPTTRYAFVHRPDHPLWTGQKIPEHRILLYDKLGPGPHPCHWCGEMVDWMPGNATRHGSLVVDHLDNDGRNNALENLVPSCHTCNVRRGMRHRMIPDDVLTIDNPHGRGKRRVEVRICQTCGVEFMFATFDTRPNRGRFCSMSCARRGKRKAT